MLAFIKLSLLRLFNKQQVSLTVVLLLGINAVPSAAMQIGPGAQKHQTEHSLSHHESSIRYTASAEEITLAPKHGLPAAAYVSFSYIRTDQTHTNRPVTFLFNGGPGSASHWLHLGGMGPQRIAIDNNTPYSIVDNPESLLSVSDLVFIDPIGTGFSKAQKTTASHNLNQEFWGVIEDAKSVTDFILSWLEQNNRLQSPVYLTGESYGTLRATLIADELERKHKFSIKGLILLSAVQNYRNIRTPDGSIMGYTSYLPTYAATAWHHKKAGQNHKELEPFLHEVRRFAMNDYASALIHGNRLSEKRKTELAIVLGHYIGLTPSYIAANNLRVDPLVFLKQLLLTERQKISRLDSRYTGIGKNPTARIYGQDPFAARVRESFVNSVQAYFNETLKIPVKKGPYITSARTHPDWNWDWNVWGEGNIPSGARFINVMPNLARTLNANQTLKVFIGAGYHDFATPFHSIENAFSELASEQDRLAFHYYKAGHIIYLDDLARQTLLADIKTFIGEPRQ